MAKIVSATHPLERFELAKAIETRQKGEWKRIAHRDSVMTVFHFAKIVLFPKKQVLKKCPTFRRFMDTEKLDHICTISKASRFPDWEAARHAVGHSAELALTREDTEKNSIRGPYENSTIKTESNTTLFLTGSLEGYGMTNTRANEHTKIAKALKTSCSNDSFASLAKTRDEARCFRGSF